MWKLLEFVGSCWIVNAVSNRFQQKNLFNHLIFNSVDVLEMLSLNIRLKK